MPVTVDKDVCIGCGACAALVPDEFELNDSGVAYAKNETVKEDLQDDVKTAMENCPTGAISIEE